MAKKPTKTQIAAQVNAERDHVAAFVGTRYGSITVTFTVGPHGPRGFAVFDRFPDVSRVELGPGGVFLSPNGANLFRLRYPAGKSSPAVAKTAVLEVMEHLCSCEVEVK